jgi:hypothetical protein
MHLSGTPLERLNTLVEREGRSNGNTQAAPSPSKPQRDPGAPWSLNRIIAAPNKP